MIDDLIKGNRSFRRFDRKVTIDRKTLQNLIDLARHSASARNLQPLKYFLSCGGETNKAIFETLSWALDLKDWPGPAEDERPSAYIVILGDKNLTNNFWCDHGIAAQSILLGARERGLGGCMLASIDKVKLQQSLKLPEHYEILLVLALGKPAEKVVIEEMGSDGKHNYWRDENSIHHVPKRPLKEIIIN